MTKGHVFFQTTERYNVMKTAQQSRGKKVKIIIGY